MDALSFVAVQRGSLHSLEQHEFGKAMGAPTKRGAAKIRERIHAWLDCYVKNLFHVVYLSILSQTFVYVDALKQNRED